MKLYYTPGACSLSPHIVLREAGFNFELEKVDLATHRTETGADYYQINPKGYVPALVLDDGQVLTEGAAIVQYLADLKPDARLAPPAGTLERARMQEQLTFIAAELHKAYGALFSPAASQEAKAAARRDVARRLDHVERQFADGRSYLLGEQLTVADIYLFVVAGWAREKGIDLEARPKLAAFLKRVGDRPSVRAAQQTEGLIEEDQAA
ncbi:MAG: glutathione transferase GstA [Caulobacterales bacterium RIFCSPHIGHO2_01_FULL_70_19]|jgi:glutathione S-transferase|nr:MAG: glutathione transferase GstA [Caulobacterales bacterium RIFCSPHIGHO2_01_FULL_70_19]